ncbi:MAG TPA: DUF2334 domain-containing protein, partial [Pseudonocardia sp.]
MFPSRQGDVTSVGLHGGVTSLIISLSGVSEQNLASCAEFATDLDARRVPVSWLLPPRPAHGRHRPDGPIVVWLRSRVAAGDALVLHGYDHTTDPIGRWSTGHARVIGRRAEFATLPRHEAALRLIAATRAVTDLGLPTDVFAPPRWLASEGTLQALRGRGFRVCADSTGVRLLGRHAQQDQVLRGRVLIIRAARAAAGPEPAEAWRHRSLVGAVGRVAKRGGPVRLDVAACDVTRPLVRRALSDAIDAALRAGAVPASYRVPVPAVAPL